MRRGLLIGALVSVALLLSAPLASATYPPGTTTFLGTYSPGQQLKTTFTGCQPGSTANLAVNGVPDGTATVASDGSVPISISIDLGPSVSVNGNTPIPVGTGSVTVTASCQDPAGNPLVNSASFNVLLASATSIAPPTSAPLGSAGGGSGASSSSGAASTPANPTTGQSSANGLAFTGADIAGTSLGALALIVVGALLIVVTRRRSRREVL